MQRWVMAVGGVWFALAGMAQASVLHSSVNGLLNVIETVQTDGTAQFAANVVRPVGSGGGNQALYAPLGGGQSVQNPAGSGGIPGQAFSTTFSDNNAAVAAVSQYASQFNGTLGKSFSPYLTRHHLGGAFFQYTQQVSVSNMPPEAVVVTFWISPSGNVDNLGGQIESNTNYVLYVKYTQRNMGTLVPQSWAQPDAGMVEWQVYSEEPAGGQLVLKPVGPVQSQVLCATAGQPCAYDATASAPDAGLINLVNQWLPARLSAANASTAILDYARTVQPASSASGAPITAVSVSARNFVQQCGTGEQLSTSGQYGFLLNYSLDRYVVTQSGNAAPTYTLVQNYSQNALSPTQNYTKAANVPASATLAAYANDIVNPFGSGTQIYDWTNDTVNNLPASDYVYVAPLSQTTQMANSGAGNVNVPGLGSVCVNQNQWRLYATGYCYSGWSRTPGTTFYGPSLYLNGQLLNLGPGYCDASTQIGQWTISAFDPYTLYFYGGYQLDAGGVDISTWNQQTYIGQDYAFRYRCNVGGSYGYNLGCTLPLNQWHYETYGYFGTGQRWWW